MGRRTLRAILLCLAAAIGVAAGALSVRSYFVADNVFWYRNSVSPGEDAPHWLPREWLPARYWVRQPHWIWNSEAGVVEVAYVRVDQLADDESDFWNSYQPSGLTHLSVQVSDPAFWSTPPTYGFVPLGMTWLDRTYPSARVWQRAVAIRLPLPFVALFALAWPTWRLVKYLRRRKVVEAGFPIEPVTG